AFIVLMAGTGIPGDSLLSLQQELIAKAYGMSDADYQKIKPFNKGMLDIVKHSTNAGQLKSALSDYVHAQVSKNPSFLQGMSEQDYVQSLSNRLAGQWMPYFLNYDPAIALQQVHCPVLAINGSKDVQVPATSNLDAIKVALAKGGNHHVTIHEFPNMNHMFQECTTGSPAEYATIDQTIAPVVLNEIASWITTQTK
nr:alpha/beta hydrolase [Chitinophagaceae bacterium]